MLLTPLLRIKLLESCTVMVISSSRSPLYHTILMELRSGSQGLKSSAAHNLEPDSGGMRQRNSEMQGDLISPDHWTINFNWHIDFPLCVTPQGLSYVPRIYLYLYSILLYASCVLLMCTTGLPYCSYRTFPLSRYLAALDLLTRHGLPAYLGHTSHTRAAPSTHTYLHCFWHV